MLYDLSPYLSLESFLSLWLIATLGLVVWLNWRSEQQEQDND